MSAILTSSTSLTDVIQTSQGRNFSEYAPLGHFFATPYRNETYNRAYTPVAGAPQIGAVTAGIINQGRHIPWINDPCRAIWDEDNQIWRAFVLTSDNPENPQQTWVEVVSPDLVNWVANRIPFYLDNLEQPVLWGGSFIVDEKNTSGYGPGSVHYLISVPGGGGYNQQSIARFIAPRLGMAPVYDGIVLGNPGVGDVVHAPGMDFRDPRVDWDEAAGHWLMKLTVGYGVAFYSSPDLKTWSFLSVLDLSAWQQIETPDLVKMVTADGTQKWVLFFSLKTWEGQPYSTVGYLVGSWDDTTFTPDFSTPKLLNWGSDYYAQAVWQKDGQTYCWAWMGNWNYSFETPSQGFRGNQSLVTTLTLAKDADGSFFLQIAPLPAQERQYPSYEQYNPPRLSTAGTASWQPDLGNPGLSWRADFSLFRASPEAWPNEISFEFCSDGTSYTRLLIQPAAGTVTLQRANSGLTPLITNDETAQSLWKEDRVAPLAAQLEYHVTVIFDVSTVEVVINGQLYISSLIYPPETAFGQTLSVSGDGAALVRFFKISC